MQEMSQMVQIVERNGDFKVSSYEVAKRFNKRHDNVLRDIRNLIKKNPEFGLANFEDVEIIEKNKAGLLIKEASYYMSRDGFIILSMGFQGEKAFQWKVVFLETFRKMEQTIKLRIPELLARIKALEENQKPQPRLNAPRKRTLIFFKKLKLKFALKTCELGIRIFEMEPIGLLSPDEKEQLRKLWEAYDEFSERLRKLGHV